MGFNQTLRRFDPAHGWTFPPHDCGGLASNQLAPVHLSPRHFCRSGPTCRSVPLRPPRLIFVGVTDRLLESSKARSAKAIGRGCGWRRLLGFDSRLRSAARALVRPGRRSCLGLCLLQGCRAHCRASHQARPRVRSPAPGTATRLSAARRSYPLVGFRDAPSAHAQSPGGAARRADGS
jgi:hypothetical protein